MLYTEVPFIMLVWYAASYVAYFVFLKNIQAKTSNYICLPINDLATVQLRRLACYIAPKHTKQKFNIVSLFC